MPGTPLGARRGWANRSGISLEELEEKYRRGLLWCYLCRSWLAIDSFGVDRSRWHGHQSVCRPCANHKHTAWQYGISVGEARHIRSGSAACEICGRRRKLEVDHDHRTGRIRGLLCSRCNTGLGQFLDDPDLLWHALRYLEENNSG